MTHEWHPIEDLGGFDENAHGELRHLAADWQDKKGKLSGDQLQNFNDRLKREWAIETGLIERAYDLNRGTTQILIEEGISEDLIPDSNGQESGKVAAMLRDHEKVVEWLFDFVRGGRELSVDYIKKIHAMLMQNQEFVVGMDASGNKRDVPLLLRGAFKEMPNDPVMPSGETHYYCPPKKVESEMERLIAMHKEHAKRGVPPLAEAAWLHHRFAQIHPFEDGNGRVARSLASLVFIKEEWFPLVIREEIRKQYLDALAAADDGDLSDLIDLFAKVQEKYLSQALDVAGAVHRDTLTAALVKSAADKLQQIEKKQLQEYEKAKETANSLHCIVCECLDRTAQEIRQQTNASDDKVRTDSEVNGGPNGYWFRGQAIEVANDQRWHYHANTDTYGAWARLTLDMVKRAEILVLFHGKGYEYRGIIGCSACFVLREDVSEGGTKVSSLEILCNKIFQIHYKESQEQTRQRFEKWLDGVIWVGLRTWSNRL